MCKRVSAFGGIYATVHAHTAVCIQSCVFMCANACMWMHVCDYAYVNACILHMYVYMCVPARMCMFARRGVLLQAYPCVHSLHTCGFTCVHLNVCAHKGVACAQMCAGVNVLACTSVCLYVAVYV